MRFLSHDYRQSQSLRNVTYNWICDNRKNIKFTIVHMRSHIYTISQTLRFCYIDRMLFYNKNNRILLLSEPWKHWWLHCKKYRQIYRKIRASNLLTNYCKIYRNTVNFLQFITFKLTVYCKYLYKKLYFVCFTVFMLKNTVSCKNITGLL